MVNRHLAVHAAFGCLSSAQQKQSPILQVISQQRLSRWGGRGGGSQGSVEIF
jgi:hypothetical protein